MANEEEEHTMLVKHNSSSSINQTGYQSSSACSGYVTPHEYEYGDYFPNATHDRQYYKMPETVRKFIMYFHDCISEGLVFEIQSLYETSFPKLTEQYFDKKPWPGETDVAEIVDNDPLFLMLYKELYYRHIYAQVSGGPTPEERVGSFFNYCDFFNYILNTEEPVSLALPDQWLWQIVDEFVYQFQSFVWYRANVQKRTTDELKLFTNSKKVWYVLCVLNVLHSLVERSNIESQLKAVSIGLNPSTVGGKFGSNCLYKMLGCYSLIGLLRLHCLLGDYYMAIKTLDHVDLQKWLQYSNVPACQVTTSYYLGFAYMMMRRYSDATRTFVSILLYIQRTKQLLLPRVYQSDQISKQREQMYHLLAICLALHPQYVDESIQQVFKEKNYYEKLFQMQCGDLQQFEACFLFACPKFLPPAPVTDEEDADDNVKMVIKHQAQVFMEEVCQQICLPVIRSYMKLYTTLPLSKLAIFMNHSRCVESGEWNLQKGTDDLRIQLLCFKHKLNNIVWSNGTSGLSGAFKTDSELDFYIDSEMIFIADTKVAHRYGEGFIRKITKIQDLYQKVSQIVIK